MDKQDHSNIQGKSLTINEADQNIRVTPFTVQIAYDHAKSLKRIKEGMIGIFDHLQSLKQLEKQPQDIQKKKKIIGHFLMDKNQALSAVNQHSNKSLKTTQKLTQNNIYLMNKAGGIGMLERKCRITEKGVLQYEDGKKQPKLKQVKSFTNFIQRVDSKNNVSKLAWIKQRQKYPFRIVLIDKNSADKAVYFQSIQQAEAARIYLIYRYNIKIGNGDNVRLFNRISQDWQSKYCQNLGKKLIQRYKSQKAKTETETDLLQQEKNKSVESPSNADKTSMIDRNSNIRKNKQIYYYQNQHQSKAASQLNNDSKGGSANHISFQDRTTQVNMRRQNSKNESVRKEQSQQNYNKSRGQQIQQNKYEPNSYFSNKFPGTSMKNQQVRHQHNFDEEINVQQDKYMSLERLDLFFTAQNPFKPHLKVQLYLQNQNQNPNNPITINYNTFPIFNKGHLTYQLIPLPNHGPETQTKNCTKIQQKPHNYRINIQLTNQVTQQLIFERSMALGKMLLVGDRFRISLYEQQQEQQWTGKGSQLIMRISGSYHQSCLKPGQIVTNRPTAQSTHKENHKSPRRTNHHNNQPSNNEPNKQEYLKRVIQSIPSLGPQVRGWLRNHSDRRLSDLGIKSLFAYIPIRGSEQLQPTDQQYEILSTCAQVLKSMNSDQAPIQKRYLWLLRMLIDSSVFDETTHLQQVFTSIIINWSPMFLQCNNHRSNLAKTLNFQDNQIDKVTQKLQITLYLFEFLLSQQCPSVVQRMNRRNIPLNYLVVQYCHFMLTKNFLPQICLELIVNVFTKYNKSTQIMLILVQVYLCEKLEQQFKQCYKLQEVQQCLQDKAKNSQIGKIRQIQQFIARMYEKLFSHNNQKYHREFQKIRNRFYEKQANSLAQNKQQRCLEKNNLALKFLQINKNTNLPVPYYKQKQHCLHIYFVTLPKISGSLYLKTSVDEFQCVNYENNPYFILSHVTSTVRLQFIDSKSNQFSFDLVFDRGFGFFKHQITSPKDSSNLDFHYWAGLFQEETMNEKFKNSKDIQKSLSSLLRIQDIKRILCKQFPESKLVKIIQKACLNNSKSQASLQQLSRKIKTVFSQFPNKIDQYELFLYLIANCQISLKQKLYILYEYSSAISSQLFLSENHSLQRIIFYDLFKHMQIPISMQQFQAFYQKMLYKYTQTYVPKVLKARFLFNYQGLRQIKLQDYIYRYIYQKRGMNYLYLDIQINEMLLFVKPVIMRRIYQVQQLVQRKVGVDQAHLKLVLSSGGEVKHYLLRIDVKNNNRQFSLNQQSLIQFDYEKQLRKIQPKVLTTGVNNNKTYKNSFKNSPAKGKLNLNSQIFLLKGTQLQDVGIQSSQISRVNICKFVIKKFKSIIPFRYKKYPQAVSFIKYNFFQDLNDMLLNMKQNKSLSQIKSIYINNKQTTSLQILSSSQVQIKIGQNNTSQLVNYMPQIGVQNNITLLKQKNPQISTVYFYAFRKQHEQIVKAKVMINHKFGVVRWQGCYVRGYFSLLRNVDLPRYLNLFNNLPRKTKKNKNKNSIIYSIIFNDKQKIIQDKYIILSNSDKTPFLGQIRQEDLMNWQNFEL